MFSVEITEGRASLFVNADDLGLEGLSNFPIQYILTGSWNSRNYSITEVKAKLSKIPEPFMSSLETYCMNKKKKTPTKNLLKDKLADLLN
jgi:hypothetical protein